MIKKYFLENTPEDFILFDDTTFEVLYRQKEIKLNTRLSLIYKTGTFSLYEEEVPVNHNTLCHKDVVKELFHDPIGEELYSSLIWGIDTSSGLWRHFE